MAINTTSFSNTPQATDDFYSLADYSIVSNQITLNVMADDLGGKAKTLYSVDDGVSSYTTTKIPAPSDLLIKDTPGTFQSFSSLHGAGLGIVDGKVVIDISAADFQTWLASFSGTQTLSFTYAIQLGNGTLSWADVSIEFQGTAVANHAPENTVPGAQSVAEDATLAFTGGNAISVHDTDGNLATTQLTVLNGTLHVDLSGGATISTRANDSATLTLSGSEAQINLALASLTYTGAADYDGNDTLTVVSTDSAGTTLSDTDTIAITVTAVADIADDVATTDEDTAANILVLANDSFEGTPAITGVTQGAHGSVSIDDNSTPGDTTDDFVVYTPDADYNGSDSFTYTVTSGGVDETATVDVTITAVADIADDVATTDEDTAANILVLANDSFEGTPAITGVTQGAHGSVSIDDNSTPGDTTDDFVVYTPDADYNGSDSFTYTVTSGGVDETATVDVTITAVADIADDVATTDEGTAANILVLANDSFEGTPAITGVTQGAHGSVSIDDNSTPGDTTDDFVVYTPDADYNGSDSFTYTVTSGVVDETATVDVTITAVADIADDVATTDEGTAANILVLANDSFEGTP